VDNKNTRQKNFEKYGYIKILPAQLPDNKQEKNKKFNSK